MSNKRCTVKSAFVFFTSLLFLFMFRNNEPYFNINNYKGILLLSVVAGVIQLVVGFAQIKHNRLVIFFILLYLVYMVFTKYVLGLSDEPYYILYISFMYLFLLCMATLNLEKKQLQFLIKSYIMSSTIMGVLLLLMHKMPYSSFDISRFALYYSENEFYDVNFTAMYMIVPTLFSYKIGTKCKDRSKKKIYIVCAIVNIIAILMLGSRSAFAPILAIIVFDFLVDRHVPMGKILILVVGILAIFFMVPKDIVVRLLGEKYINLESKRIIDWQYGIDAFKKSPWFGNGMIPPRKMVTQIAGVNWYTIHNTYIVYLAQLGIVGCIPVLAIFIYPLIKLWNGMKKPFMFLSYCAILFAALMIESNYTYVLIVPLSIFYSLIHFSERNHISNVLESVLNLEE